MDIDEEPLSRDRVKGRLEALLFAAARPLTLKAIACGLNLSEEQLEQALAELGQDLEFADRGLRLRRVVGGWRLETKPEHAAVIAACAPMLAVRPLSAQALETLAIVALKQPVTLAEIDAIRGVHSQGTVETLRRRKLIAPAGQRRGQGTAPTGGRLGSFWRDLIWKAPAGWSATWSAALGWLAAGRGTRASMAAKPQLESPRKYVLKLHRSDIYSTRTPEPAGLPELDNDSCAV